MTFGNFYVIALMKYRRELALPWPWPAGFDIFI